MGQQQLLLIIVGMIIIALAIYVGISYFRTNAIETKRNNVIEEGLNLATMAQQHYMRPAETGGGGKSFSGWEVPAVLAVTPNGRFEADVEDEQVLITGTGNEVVTGTDSVKVQITVTAYDIQTEIIN